MPIIVDDTDNNNNNNNKTKQIVILSLKSTSFSQLIIQKTHFDTYFKQQDMHKEIERWRKTMIM